MNRKFKLKKRYPSLPKTINEGDMIEFNIVFQKYHKALTLDIICKEEVENNPEFWEEVIEDITVFDVIGNCYYKKQSNGKWRCHGRYNQVNPVDTIEYFIKDNEIGKIRYVIKEEKIIEKDYEILSFKILEDEYVLYSPGKYSRVLGYSRVYSLEEMLETNNEPKIHSVKRLSDGEIFTVGDKIAFYRPDQGGRTYNSEIKSFYTVKEQMNVTTGGSLENIKNISHIKKPLFTTEDGIDLYKGDKYFQIGIKFNNIECEAYDENNFDDKLNIFSTKEAAEKYILMNKKQFSINDFEKLGADRELINQAIILSNGKSS